MALVAFGCVAAFSTVQSSAANTPEALVLSSKRVLENQAVGSVVGKLQGIDSTVFHRDSILHQGFMRDVASESFLDLNQNGQLDTLEWSGERILTDKLRFSNVNAFVESSVHDTPETQQLLDHIRGAIDRGRGHRR